MLFKHGVSISTDRRKRLIQGHQVCQWIPRITSVHSVLLVHYKWTKGGLISTFQGEQIGPSYFYFTTESCIWNRKLRQQKQTHLPNQYKMPSGNICTCICFLKIAAVWHVWWIAEGAGTQPAQQGRQGSCNFTCPRLNYTEVRGTEVQASHRQAEHKLQAAALNFLMAKYTRSSTKATTITTKAQNKQKKVPSRQNE